MSYFLTTILLGAIMVLVNALPLDDDDDMDLETLHPNWLGTCFPNLCALPPRTFGEDQFIATAAYMNEVFAYYVVVATKDGNMVLMVDTGSGETWINDKESEMHEKGLKECEWLKGVISNGTGLRTEALDDTGDGIDNFDVDYLDLRRVDGVHVLARVAVASGFVHEEDPMQMSFHEPLVIRRQGLGIAYNSQQCLGIVGVGYYDPSGDENESEDDLERNASMVKNLRNDGKIQSEAYSLYPLPLRGGYILFGAVDGKRFKGDLVRLSMVRTQPPRPAITITKIMTNRKDWPDSEKLDDFSSARKSEIAFLDTGSVLTYLRRNDVDKLVEAYKEEFPNSDIRRLDTPENLQVPCGWRNSSRYVSFIFSTMTIEVSSKELILEIPEDRTSERICIFGVASTEFSDKKIILGYTFLRSAYVVVHLGNHEIFLAQYDVRAKGSDIQSIKGSHVPFAGQTLVESGSTTTKAPTTVTLRTNEASKSLSSRETGSSTERSKVTTGTNPAPTNSSDTDEGDLSNEEATRTSQAPTGIPAPDEGETPAADAAAIMWSASLLTLWGLSAAVALLFGL